MKLIFSIFFLTTMVSAEIPQIIPTPQTIIEKNVQFKITSATKIVIGNDNQTVQFIAQLLNDELSVYKESLLKVVDEKSVRKLTSNFIFIGKPASEYGKKFLLERKGILTPAMKSEGYFLDVDAKGVVIIAESDKGLFYGVMSLIQMLHFEKRSLIIHGACACAGCSPLRPGLAYERLAVTDLFDPRRLAWHQPRRRFGAQGQSRHRLQQVPCFRRGPHGDDGYKLLSFAHESKRNDHSRARRALPSI